MLLDTGSASTVLSADRVSELGIKLEADDPIHRMGAVGGAEFVSCKQLPWVVCGGCRAVNLSV
jgi:hypothetical protein